jgi:hypothetical protein
VIHFKKKTSKNSMCGKPTISKTGEKTFFSPHPEKVTCQRCLKSLEVRARKVTEKSNEKDLKHLEDECRALWRKAVHWIWDGHCALCGKPTNDHDAHHYFTKGIHAGIKYEINCGILLCYGCHIGKVHKGGEVEKLRDVYIDKIGLDRFESLKERSDIVTKYNFESLLAVRGALFHFRRNDGQQG